MSKQLEERIGKLEEKIKKAEQTALIAVFGAVLGSGGLFGIVQWYSGSGLRRADTTIHEQQVRLNEQDLLLKSQSQKLNEADLELKRQNEILGDYEIKYKALAAHREEFNQHLEEYKAAQESLQKAIDAAKAAGRNEQVSLLVGQLIEQNQAFAAFAAQTEQFVRQLPGAPSWYASAVQQVRAQTEQNSQRLQQLRNGLSKP